MTHTAGHRRFSFLLLAGWIVALPGLWVIGSFLIQGPVSVWAGCPGPTGMVFPPCPPGGAGAIADAMRATVLVTLLASFIGIGILPPLYSGLFVATRLVVGFSRWWQRRHGAPESGVSGWRLAAISLGVFLALVMAAGMVGRIMADASSGPPALAEFAQGLLGLAVMAGLVYVIYRLVRFGLGKLRGA
jgi:hypothetical protein